MSIESNKSLIDARQQLSQLIQELKQHGQRDNLVPTLETVLNQLENMAQTDHLTGALNRRTLIHMLDGELARSFRTGHTFSFVVISVDGLEHILEQHGQTVARQVLQLLAKEALMMLRTLDSFGRVAANEFAIVMPTTWLDQGVKAINRLKARVAQVDWNSVAPGLQISFSTGMTTNAIKDTAGIMLQRANNALLEARAKGVNQIVQTEPPLPDYDPSAPD